MSTGPYRLATPRRLNPPNTLVLYSQACVLWLDATDAASRMSSNVGVPLRTLMARRRHAERPAGKETIVPTRLRRPAAVPLVTIDPHTSVWSLADRLTDDWPRHWTGTKMALYGVVRVDGVPYRFMGGAEFLARAATQLSLAIGATQTTYVFHAGAIELTVVFTSPLLPDDPDLLSRPATYLTLTARPLDAHPHDVLAYVDMTGEWAVNLPHDRVVWEVPQAEGIQAASFRAEHQRVLAEAGDHRRIEWGSAFLALAAADGTLLVGDIDHCRDAFVAEGVLRAGPLKPAPRKTDYNSDPVAAAMLPLPLDGGARTLVIAYDDEWSIEHMGQRLRPWWRRHPDAAAAPMLTAALREAGPVLARCAAFDADLMRRATDVAGPGYADLLALTWRQAIAAHKLVQGADGRMLFFSKENFSNGCIATVDVTYPSAPLFLLYAPALLKGMLDPVLEYCASPDWPHPFPAHDLGTYPIANGQTYRDFQTRRGPDENIVETQMPVEEAGNMLVLLAAITRADGSAAYAAPHWALLRQWADYLVDWGLDPGAQLCTDDFAGVLGHNVNLSAKAIMGLGGFAQIAARLGHADDAARYRAIAEGFAADWLRLARDGAGTRLAFDQPGTWSLKYNLVWDRLLGLDLFPEAELRREQAFYRTKAEAFGTPLDSRGTVTKPEWMLWAACLTPDPALLGDTIDRILRYANETPNRVPFSDLYFSDNARKMGFQARSVVGGFWIALLAEACRRG